MNASKGQSEKIRRKLGMVDIEDLALDFTIPGYDLELRVSAQLYLRTGCTHENDTAWGPRSLCNFGER